MRNQTAQTEQSRDNRTAGFTLVELLIVVSVILVIAAIAIPNFIQSKMRSNEAAAVEDLRTIVTGEIVYDTTYSVGYSPDLASLGGTDAIPSASSAEMIDEALASGVRSGYTFTYAVTARDPLGNPVTFSVNADPLVQGTTGQRHFYVDQTTIIRQNQNQAAGPSDPAIQ